MKAGAVSLIPEQALGTAIKGVLVLAGSALGYFFIVKPLVKKFSDSAELKSDQASTIKPKPGKPLFNLKGQPITGANLSTIAVDLENAISWPTDQDRVVRVFLSTPWGHVQQLEKIYLSKYGKNLKQELVDNLSDTNWIKIKFYFK